jgi:hypothetical protein
LGLIINKLETQQEIEDYKKWLGTRPRHSLNYFIKMFKRDMNLENPVYVNHKLRIKLVTDEINNRLN